jgi:hypothetical protein
MNKDVQQLLRRVRRQGFRVRVGGTGHYLVSRHGKRTTLAATPRGGRRSLANARAALRRIGADL